MNTQAFKTFICFITMAFPTLILAQQNLTFGRFQSRAIFTPSDDPSCLSPLVILVPGSGPNGPEEMVPAGLTGNGIDYSIFDGFSKGLHRGHVATLAIGKPGVEFFHSWQNQDRFYNLSIYENLTWPEMIDNLKDAVDFAKTLPCVDGNRIAILGHSEGTQVAIDYTQQNPATVQSLILVGFLGENMRTTVSWQLFSREVDLWLTPDVDANHDGVISKSEADNWPEFKWPWQPQQEMVTMTEISDTLKLVRQPTFQAMESAKIWEGVFDRHPIYTEAVSLPQNVYVFTGELDVQTRPEESLNLKNECLRKLKRNCDVTIVPGLGHAMSLPRGPRRHKLVDATLGPVEDSFLPYLEATARKLRQD